MYLVDVVGRVLKVLDRGRGEADEGEGEEIGAEPEQGQGQKARLRPVAPQLARAPVS